MRAPAPARSVSVSFLMSISSQRKPQERTFQPRHPFQENWRWLSAWNKTLDGNRRRKCSLSGTSRRTFNRVVVLFAAKFCLQFVSRDRHGFNCTKSQRCKSNMAEHDRARVLTPATPSRIDHTLAPQRHIPRMRAPTSMRGPWLAGRAATPAAARGQTVFSNRPSRRSGINRVREA